MLSMTSHDPDVVEIRYAPITTSDVTAYRTARLRALREDSTAFVERFEDASAWPLQRWTDRVLDNEKHDQTTTHLAWLDDRVVGMATGVLSTTAGAPELVGMWVAPEARGRGVGAELVRRIAAWATEASSLALELWVITGNDHAISLYQRCGFRIKHDHRAPPDDPCRDEVRMRLD